MLHFKIIWINEIKSSYWQCFCVYWRMLQCYRSGMDSNVFSAKWPDIGIHAIPTNGNRGRPSTGQLYFFWPHNVNKAYWFQRPNWCRCWCSSRNFEDTGEGWTKVETWALPGQPAPLTYSILIVLWIQ